MTVDLNLLSADEGGRKIAGPGRLTPVSFCVFLLLATFIVVSYEYYFLHALRGKRIASEKELSAIRAEKSALEAKLGVAEARLDGADERLDFILGGVRAAEILSELTACATKDVAIERLEIDAGGVILYGRTKNELDMSEFHEALSSSRFFGTVSEPRVSPGAEPGLSFFLRCEMTDIVDFGDTSD